jgi:hypothetical protein
VTPWFSDYLERADPAPRQQRDTHLGPYIGHTHLAKGSGMQVYAAITKVQPQSDGTIKVYGVASTPQRDDQNEVITADAVRTALPRFMLYPSLREMHQMSAAGTVLEAETGDDGVTRVVAHVVDPSAVAKVKNQVYRGFSLGGAVLERDPDDPCTITRLRLDELSLVDRPANPSAKVELWKRGRMPEPTPMWHCGKHSHLTKEAAALCRVRREMSNGGEMNSKSKQQRKAEKRMRKALAKARGEPVNQEERAVAIITRPIVPDSADNSVRKQGFSDFQALYRATRRQLVDPRLPRRGEPMASVTDRPTPTPLPHQQPHSQLPGGQGPVPARGPDPRIPHTHPAPGPHVTTPIGPRNPG